MLDSFTLTRIGAIMNGYIAQKVPPELRVSVRLTYDISRDELILAEERPSACRYVWDKVNIARFCWSEEGWRVYAPSSEDKSWICVDVIQPSMDFEAQLEQVERDSLGIFWPE
ncbi:hypothetical protein AWM70_07420 [Paenibacillus yonginensis]|uniref:Uncharacterized protein n=1 Tax=Paenibacillus yonginensis TaxID=1462996 RepID=A0A1B1MZ24_9BACL|nr:DUF3024 domain-containing protein [Paenibacillus yonginensis]ANS74430.1 hypothetical protein AWM70_07420 [Paenibacillus yonginensis]